jgi:alcohol dehydrogenase (cytochrome c)
VLARRVGANWPPSAYDPRTQTLFVCGNDRTFFYSVDADATDEPTSGTNYMAGSFGTAELPPLGLLTAMDMKTNTVVWQQRWANRCFSGIAATGGDLIFVGRNDGRLTALDSTNGMRLWEFQTGAGMNAPASVFEHEGEQYVVALSAGNLFAGTPRGDSVWLFGLSGTLDEAQPADSTPALVTAPAGGQTEASDGPGIYLQACQFCHGQDARGAENGMDLTMSELDDLAAIALVIRDGRNTMPAFGGLLSEEQLEAVARHVLGITRR